MKAHMPVQAKIGPHTMVLMEHRKALAEQGQYKDVSELDRLIQQSARDDKMAWIREGLRQSLWAPVREIARRRPQAVVSLRGPGGGLTWSRPADVYVGHLASEQWGRPGPPEGGPPETRDRPAAAANAEPLPRRS